MNPMIEPFKELERIVESDLPVLSVPRGREQARLLGAREGNAHARRGDGVVGDAATASDGLQQAYARGENDEFVKPTVIVNGDGKPDIAAGRNLYLAPDWTKFADFRERPTFLFLTQLCMVKSAVFPRFLRLLRSAT